MQEKTRYSSGSVPEEVQEKDFRHAQYSLGELPEDVQAMRRKKFRKKAIVMHETV